MFVYSYFLRSNKHFGIFRTVLRVLLSYINTVAGMTSLLHNFCRDHSRQKSNTSIKKRSPHHQHHIGSPYQHALRRCRARASIIFTFFTCHGARAYLCTILVAICPCPMVPAAKIGKEFICCARAHAAAWYLFFLNSYFFVNSNKFLCSSPKYRYLPLFFFCSYFASSLHLYSDTFFDIFSLASRQMFKKRRCQKVRVLIL